VCLQCEDEGDLAGNECCLSVRNCDGEVGCTVDWRCEAKRSAVVQQWWDDDGDDDDDGGGGIE
jgi:hypothetical protein